MQQRKLVFSRLVSFGDFSSRSIKVFLYFLAPSTDPEINVRRIRLVSGLVSYSYIGLHTSTTDFLNSNSTLLS